MSSSLNNTSSNQMKLDWNQHNERDSESSSHITADFVISEDGIMFDSSEVSSVQNIDYDISGGIQDSLPDGFKASESLEGDFNAGGVEGGDSTSLNLTELEEEGSLLMAQALKVGRGASQSLDDSPLQGPSTQDDDSFDWGSQQQQQLTPRRTLLNTSAALMLDNSDLSVASATDSALQEFQELEAQILGDLHLSSSNTSTASGDLDDTERPNTELAMNRPEVLSSSLSNTEKMLQLYLRDRSQAQITYSDMLNQGGAAATGHFIGKPHQLLSPEFFLSPTMEIAAKDTHHASEASMGAGTLKETEERRTHRPSDFIVEEEEDYDGEEQLVTINEYRPRPEMQVDPIQVHDQILQKMQFHKPSEDLPQPKSLLSTSKERMSQTRPKSGASTASKSSVDTIVKSQQQQQRGKSKTAGEVIAEEENSELVGIENAVTSATAAAEARHGLRTVGLAEGAVGKQSAARNNRPVTKRSNATTKTSSPSILELDAKKRSRSRDEVQDWLNTSPALHLSTTAPEEMSEAEKVPTSGNFHQESRNGRGKRRNSGGGESSISHVTHSSAEDHLRPLPSAKELGFASPRHQYRAGKGVSGGVTHRTTGSSHDASSTISSLDDAGEETVGTLQSHATTLSGESSTGGGFHRRGRQESRASLQQRLQQEISMRKEHQTYIRQLQTYYDSLLAKHALAELTIDQLRLGAHVNITTRRNNLLGGGQGGSAVPGGMYGMPSGASRGLLETRAQSVAALPITHTGIEEPRSMTPTGTGRHVGASAAVTSLGLHLGSHPMPPAGVGLPQTPDFLLSHKTPGGAVQNTGMGGIYQSLPSSPVPPKANDGDTQRLQFLFRAATLQDQMELLAQQADQWVNGEHEEEEEGGENHRKAPNRHEAWAHALRGEYDALQRDYNHMLQQPMPPENSPEQEEMQQLEGDLFQLGMQLDEVENRVRDNLRAARRRTPFQFSEASGTAASTPAAELTSATPPIKPGLDGGQGKKAASMDTASATTSHSRQPLEVVHPERGGPFRKLTASELDDLERNYLNTLKMYNEVKQRSTTPNHYKEMQRLMGNLRHMVHVAGDQSQVVNTPLELEEQFRLDQEMLDLNRELQEVEQQQQLQDQQDAATAAYGVQKVSNQLREAEVTHPQGGKFLASSQRLTHTAEVHTPKRATAKGEWSHLGIYGDEMHLSSDQVFSPHDEEETSVIVLPPRDKQQHAANRNRREQHPISDGSLTRMSTGDEYFDRDDSGKESGGILQLRKTPASLRSSVDTSRSERIRGLEEEVRRLREQLGESSSLGADDNLSGLHGTARRSQSSRPSSRGDRLGGEDYYDHEPRVHRGGTGTTHTRGDSSSLSRSTALPQVGDEEEDDDEVQPQRLSEDKLPKRRSSLPGSHAGSRSSALRGSESGLSGSRRNGVPLPPGKRRGSASRDAARRRSSAGDGSGGNQMKKPPEDSSTDTSPERPHHKRLSSATRRQSNSNAAPQTGISGENQEPLSRVSSKASDRRRHRSKSQPRDSSAATVPLAASSLHPWNMAPQLAGLLPPSADAVGGLIMHVDSSSSATEVSSIENEEKFRGKPRASSTSRRQYGSKRPPSGAAFIPEAGLAPRDESMRRANPKSRDRWCQTRPLEGKNRSVAVMEQAPSFMGDMPLNGEDGEAWNYWNSGKFFPSRGPLPASILRKRQQQQQKQQQSGMPSGTASPMGSMAELAAFSRNAALEPGFNYGGGPGLSSASPGLGVSTGSHMSLQSPAALREYNRGVPSPIRYYVREYSMNPPQSMGSPAAAAQYYRPAGTHNLNRSIELYASGDDESDEVRVSRRRFHRSRSPESGLLQDTVTGALRTAQNMRRLTKKMKCDLQNSLRSYPASVATGVGSQWSVLDYDLNRLGMAN